jgi:hypothetical protein
MLFPVLRIRDVNIGTGSRSEFFLPGYRTQGHKDPGSFIRIRVKEFKYF